MKLVAQNNTAIIITVIVVTAADTALKGLIVVLIATAIVLAPALVTVLAYPPAHSSVWLMALYAQ